MFVKIKTSLKKFLPSKIYNFIRMKPRIMIISKSLKDRIKYINECAWKNDPDYRGDQLGMLRKYGHMIDKGLQSPNRTSGRGIDVANTLRILLSERKSEDGTYLWAEELLKKYDLLQDNKLATDDYSNFIVENSNLIDKDTLFLFIKERRTLRHFKQGEIPDKDKILEILSASIWAPSSCNRQSIVTYYTCNQDIVSACLKQNKGATAISGNCVFVSVCFDTRAYHLPQESLTGYIDSSLGFQNSLLMAHSMNLGACILNWSHSTVEENLKLRKLLKIKDYHEISFNVIIGIPESGAPIPGKKSVDELIKEVA